MTEPDIIDNEANKIYESNREEWERLYSGMIIAIDIDNKDMVSVGKHASEVGLEAKTKRPGHRIFMRRVGKNPSITRHNHISQNISPTTNP